MSIYIAHHAKSASNALNNDGQDKDTSPNVF